MPLAKVWCVKAARLGSRWAPPLPAQSPHVDGGGGQRPQQRAAPCCQPCGINATVPSGFSKAPSARAPAWLSDTHGGRSFASNLAEKTRQAESWHVSGRPHHPGPGRPRPADVGAGAHPAELRTWTRLRHWRREGPRRQQRWSRTGGWQWGPWRRRWVETRRIGIWGHRGQGSAWPFRRTPGQSRLVQTPRANS